MLKIYFVLFVLCFSTCIKAQNVPNWTPNQLIEPAQLSADIKKDKDVPFIICVGPGAIIPHSVNAGMTGQKEGLDKFKSIVKDMPKNSKIVIYCGCCPFERCPNIRPAISMLKEMKFTNYYLLDLSTNIKTDWINKGYPVNKE